MAGCDRPAFVFVVSKGGDHYGGMVRYACISIGLADLRAEPDHHSERLSQVLFGEPLHVISKRAGFLKVRQRDGYSGWLDQRYVTELTAGQYRSCNRAADAVVRARMARLYPTTTSGPHFLWYGTPLFRLRTSGGYVSALLPNGGQLRLRRGAVRVMTRPTAAVTGRTLVNEARRFLGVPYLWGGITPAGFDCSGLVRAVYGSHGICLPRDTKDQVKVGYPIDRIDIRAGDLLFFRRHVALAIDRQRFIHASRGGGGVTVNSLDPHRLDFRPDLNDTFAQARRIL